MADRPRFDGPDGELLDRYLAGECSEAETAAVRRFLMARPDAARAIDGFVQGLDGAATRPPAPDAAASWASVRRRLRAEARDVDGDPRPSAPTPTGERAAIAAIAAIAAVGAEPHPGVAGQRRVRESGRHRSFVVMEASPRPTWRRRVVLGAAAAAALVGAVAAERAAARVQIVQPPPPRVYETAVRQRAELRLDDGTRVRLAPASRLRVATDFGTERRDVYLDGEAYFDVAHDDRRPFTVYVGNASARDLGTAFAARGYADDGAVQVVVREGEVAMSGVGRLGAGDLGRLATEGRATVRRGVKVDELLGWVDGRLDFEDARLGQVLRDLGRWYGTDLRLADPTLASLPFTGSLTGLPADAALDVVAATLGLRVRRGGAKGGPVVLERIPGRTPRSGTSRPGRTRRAAALGADEMVGDSAHAARRGGADGRTDGNRSDGST